MQKLTIAPFKPYLHLGMAHRTNQSLCFSRLHIKKIWLNWRVRDLTEQTIRNDSSSYSCFSTFFLPSWVKVFPKVFHWAGYRAFLCHRDPITSFSSSAQHFAAMFMTSIASACFPISLHLLWPHGLPNDILPLLCPLLHTLHHQKQ